MVWQDGADRWTAWTNGSNGGVLGGGDGWDRGRDVRFRVTQQSLPRPRNPSAKAAGRWPNEILLAALGSIGKIPRRPVL